MTERVLLVDDEPEVLDGIRRHLARRFDIDTATSGREALKKLATGEGYAVIVADMKMPLMSGIELLREVRIASPHTVGMMLTGFGDKQTAEDAVKNGHVFHFLSKPCNSDDLGTAIAACLELFRLNRKIRDLQTSMGSMDNAA